MRKSGARERSLHEKAPARLGTASAMLVGEPTGNQLVCGHKGALFVRARASGITAHSSTPERGVNAIYKAARAITRLERLKLPVSEDAFMGSPTLNVGMISGGLNANSVQTGLSSPSTCALGRTSVMHLCSRL